MADFPEENGSDRPSSPPSSSRNLSPAPSPRPPTPGFDHLFRNLGAGFDNVTQDIPKADPDAKVPDRVHRNVSPSLAALSMAGDPSAAVPDTSAGSETASNHSTVAGTSTVSPKTSMDSTSERGVDESTPLPRETSSPHPSTFDLPVRTGSNSDAHPAGNDSAPSHADKENKRKASASETDTTPHKKAAPSDAWLD